MVPAAGSASSSPVSDDGAGLAVLAAVGDAAAELDGRVGGVGRGQAGGGVAQLPVAQVAAQAGDLGLVRGGVERGLDLGDLRRDQAQAAGGDEVRQRADRDLRQRLGARPVVFLHKCAAHGSTPLRCFSLAANRARGQQPPVRHIRVDGGAGVAYTRRGRHRAGMGRMLRALAAAVLVAAPAWRRRRRRPASRSTWSWCCWRTRPDRSTRPRSGCSGRAMPTRWSIREVLWAIGTAAAQGRIAVAYVEWATATAQDVVVDWMVVEDEASARRFGERLMAAPRRAYGSNAIGAALLKGLALIEGNGFEGWRKVIDLSGDSSWNPQGPTDRRCARRRARRGRGDQRAGDPLPAAVLRAAALREPGGGIRRQDHRRARAPSWSPPTASRASRRRCGAS